jgi:uncharacterized membrane protein YidH (DUF202 family)
MLHRLWNWLNYGEVVSHRPPLDPKMQNFYDKSFDYKESQRDLVFTILIAAAAVLHSSTNHYMIRLAAGLLILCVIYALLAIRAQNLINKTAKLPEPAVRVNLDKIVFLLLVALVMLGIMLLLMVFWRGSVKMEDPPMNGKTAINYESIPLWVAIASLMVSVAAVFIAWSSLSQAKQVADRDRRDWKQRKWFDLYFKANEIHDSLDRFQTLYDDATPCTTEFQKDWNDLMFLIREVQSMAVVFPKNSVIEEFLSCTAVFKDRAEVLSKCRLKKVFNAVEGIRLKALLDPTVLE